MKKIANMRKDEIIDLFIKYNLEVPDEATKKELIVELSKNNIDDEFLETMGDDVSPVSDGDVEPILSESQVPVKMNRKNRLFAYGKYQWTQEKPLILVPLNVAYEIINKFDGFKILEASEVERLRKK